MALTVFFALVFVALAIVTVSLVVDDRKKADEHARRRADLVAQALQASEKTELGPAAQVHALNIIGDLGTPTSPTSGGIDFSAISAGITIIALGAVLLSSIPWLHPQTKDDIPGQGACDSAQFDAPTSVVSERTAIASLTFKPGASAACRAATLMIDSAQVATTIATDSKIDWFLTLSEGPHLLTVRRGSGAMPTAAAFQLPAQQPPSPLAVGKCKVTVSLPTGPQSQTSYAVDISSPCAQLQQAAHLYINGNSALASSLGTVDVGGSVVDRYVVTKLPGQSAPLRVDLIVTPVDAATIKSYPIRASSPVSIQSLGLLAQGIGGALTILIGIFSAAGGLFRRKGQALS